MLISHKNKISRQFLTAASRLLGESSAICCASTLLYIYSCVALIFSILMRCNQNETKRSYVLQNRTHTCLVACWMHESCSSCILSQLHPCDSSYPVNCGSGSRDHVAELMLPLPTCSLCTRGRPPTDTLHTPPWFMSHLSRLMFLSPKTGCSRLALCTALHGHCLGMPRSTVIKLYQVRAEGASKWLKKTTNLNARQTRIKEYISFMFEYGSYCTMEGFSVIKTIFLSLEYR